MYIVTIETNNKFRTDPPPHRYVTEGEYYASDNSYRRGWYFPDFSGDKCGELELAEELGYKVVAWQDMPEAYMGE